MRVTIEARSRHGTREDEIGRIAADRCLSAPDIAQQICPIGIEQRVIGRPPRAIQIDGRLFHDVQMP